MNIASQANKNKNKEEKIMLPVLFRTAAMSDLMNRCFDSDDNCDWGTEDKDNVYVYADLPGVKPEDIKVEVDESGILSIRGERKVEKEFDRNSCYRIERQYGSFERRFRLGQSVAGDNIKAEYKHGELKLTIPKKEEKKPKAITIEVKE